MPNVRGECRPMHVLPSEHRFLSEYLRERMSSRLLPKNNQLRELLCPVHRSLCHLRHFRYKLHFMPRQPNPVQQLLPHKLPQPVLPEHFKLRSSAVQQLLNQLP